MNLPSLADSSRKKHLTTATRRKVRRAPRLHIESLEAREVPATVPTVLSVTPATGQPLGTNIVVTFSEDVTGAGTAGNYKLFAQDGQAFPFAVTYDSGTHTATVTPTGTLPAGTYSLFIQGDQIRDTDGDNLRLAQPGEVVVANSGSGRLTTASVSAAGLGAPTTLNLAGGAGPRQPAVGDLNGDGILDLAAPAANNAVQIFFGRTTGGYNPTPTVVNLGAGNGPISVALGDVDGDGDLDIVTANRTSNSIAVLKNNGTGTFAAPIFMPVGQTPTDLVLGDFNGDGALDVAVSHNGLNSTNRGVTVRLNTGAGTFQAPSEYLQGVHAGAIATGDFDRDGKVDLAVADSQSVGTVRILRGSGTGSFTEQATLSVGASPADLVVADFNADGFSDIATVSGSGTTSRNVTVLLNSAGAGFRAPLHTAIPDLQLIPSLPNEIGGNTPLQSLAVVYGNQDPYPDLIVSTQSPSFQSNSNIELLTGLGDGSFSPFTTGATLGAGSPAYVSVVSDPFRLLSAFDVQSTTVRVNLVRNGDFEARSLDGSQGSLDGWTIFNQRDATSGSHGTWSVQSDTASPLSGTPLDPAAYPSGPAAWPTGTVSPQGFQAMLDEQHLQPLPPNAFFDPNLPDSYAGSHALYQDITIPAGVTSAKLSLKLSLDSFATWSNTGDNPSLDYRTQLDNQQVRVDIMKPGSDVLNVTSDVLLNIFTTTPSDPTQQTQTFTNIDLSAYAGQTIRLRIASANNLGQLIVGVDDVKLEVVGTDTTSPVLSP
ncbi:MAG: VCBS repeat-containing protein, partial [Zavarzinella sp.]|nr:VCBS repeat-containing protein [Zavarzinella sp.]